MITIIAKNTVKPEMVEAFKTAARPLIEASQKEAGCIFYDLYEDVKNPSILTFIERWRDEDAIAKHNASEHFKAIVPSLGAFCIGASEVSLYKMV